MARERGWTKYVPPVVERMMTFNEEMTGWFGLSGRKFILAEIPDRTDEERSTSGILIPEGTASVCRFAAQQVLDKTELFSKMPVKLFYAITCFRNEPDNELSETKLKAFGQLGFEFLGSGAPEPDIESIRLAADCIRELGVPADCMRIRLGDVSIFRKVSDGIGEKRKRYDIQQFLDGLSKERAMGAMKAAEERIREAVTALTPYSSAKSVNLLCTQTGGPELITEIERELGLDLSSSKRITAALTESGLPVIFDPAVVRAWSYYTGPVFQIDLADDIFYPEIAGGGRYDILIGEFAKRYGLSIKMSATGFAFGSERLEELFKKYNQ